MVSFQLVFIPWRFKVYYFGAYWYQVYYFGAYWHRYVFISYCFSFFVLVYVCSTWFMHLCTTILVMNSILKWMRLNVKKKMNVLVYLSFMFFFFLSSIIQTHTDSVNQTGWSASLYVSLCSNWHISTEFNVILIYIDKFNYKVTLGLTKKKTNSEKNPSEYYIYS